jgi:peptidoglycan/xylan/chitin deacetylase (PgdA/CDA1 family)
MKRLFKILMARILPIRYRGDRRQPLLYLTFDDGLTPGTMRVLEVLARHGVTATFFIVGKRIAGNESALAEIVRAGHVVGNHSFEHRAARELSRHEISLDVERCNQAIRAVIPDWQPRLYRPPYGQLSLGLLSLATIQRWQIVMWSKDSVDYRAATADDIDTNLGEIRNGDILLFHDEFPVTPGAIDRLIRRCHARGYRFAGL